MKIEIKISEPLLNQVTKDLIRPHEFAFERVGFLFTRIGKITAKKTLLLFTDYMSVPDNYYLNDPDVGARISGDAIRAVMQRILNTKEGAFHVHMHHYFPNFSLGFSRVDQQGIGRMIQSFQAAGPTLPHGAFLYDSKRYLADVLMPCGKQFIRAKKITVVGFPTQIYKEKQKCQKIDTIDNRSLAIKAYSQNVQ